MQQHLYPQQSYKNTPGSGRRRHPRGSGNTPHKAYVSENDVGAYKQMQSESPCTPQKKSAPRVAPNTSLNSKQRSSRNNQNQGRNRTKTSQGTSSSPAANHHSPPLAATDAPPIFAGSTFHASPAASALPVPSFFKRSTDSPLSKSTPASGPELSPPSTDSESATPPTPHAAPGARDSPLEFFFQADRAEKEKTRRASSANVTQTPGPFPFSPPRNSPLTHNTVPRTAPNHGGPQVPASSLQRTQGPAIPPAELDGDSGQPFGPAFSTPYHERIRAARSSQQAPKPPGPEPQRRGPELDPSDALKQFLFQGKFESSHQAGPPTPNYGQNHGKQPDDSGCQHPGFHHSKFAASQQPTAPQPPPLGHHWMESVYRGAPFEPGPPQVKPASQPVAQSGMDPDSILHMEDSLRRVLNLGPPS